MRSSLKFNIPIHAVHGNNSGDVYALYRMLAKTNGQFTYYGEDAVLELGGRKIFVTHMPHYGQAFACTGDYDLVCHGSRLADECRSNSSSFPHRRKSGCFS